MVIVVNKFTTKGEISARKTEFDVTSVQNSAQDGLSCYYYFYRILPTKRISLNIFYLFLNFFSSSSFLLAWHSFKRFDVYFCTLYKKNFTNFLFNLSPLLSTYLYLSLSTMHLRTLLLQHKN